MFGFYRFILLGSYLFNLSYWYFNYLFVENPITLESKRLQFLMPVYYVESTLMFYSSW